MKNQFFLVEEERKAADVRRQRDESAQIAAAEAENRRKEETNRIAAEQERRRKEEADKVVADTERKRKQAEAALIAEAERKRKEEVDRYAAEAERKQKAVQAAHTAERNKSFLYGMTAIVTTLLLIFFIGSLMLTSELKLKNGTSLDTVAISSGVQSPSTYTALNPNQNSPACSYCPEMVLVQGGSFQMGRADGEVDEKPVHRVSVSSFSMGKTEITVAQFRAFIYDKGYSTDSDKGRWSWVWSGSKYEKKNGVNWKFDAEGNIRSKSEYTHPVIHVSWNDATAYCGWLSRKTGKTYRLPTEAEWEYAAGNGSKHTKFSWGNGDPEGKKGGNVADENTKEKINWADYFKGYRGGYVYTAPVGSYDPNDFGLYDMTGNVWEWCSDWYNKDYYSVSSSQNPRGLHRALTARSAAAVGTMDLRAAASRAGAAAFRRTGAAALVFA